MIDMTSKVAMLRRLLPTSLALALFAATCNGALAQDSITLEDAINLSLSNNPSLNQTRLQTNSSDLSVGVARSEFQLSVRPEGGVLLDDEGDSSGFYGLRVSKKTGYGGEISVSGINDSLFGAEGGNRFNVQFSQPLFRQAGTLVNREGIVQAEQSYLSSLRALELSRSRTVVAVVEAYEQVLRLEQQLAADEQALQRAASLYKLTLAKERLGRTTRIDTLRVQLQQGEAVSRTSNTREQLSSARRVLGELMGREGGALPRLEPAPMFQVEFASLEEATNLAMANRLEYAQAQQEYEDSIRATRIAKRFKLPDMTLVARYEHNDNDLLLDEDLNGFRNAWYLSLVSDTDFNKNREKLEYEQSLVQQSSALENLRAQYLAIGREVEQALLAYLRAHKQLDVLEGNFQHAGARLKLARRLFRVGRTDGFSVTDAEQAYFTAQSTWLNGRSDASIAGYRLLHATGTLVETPANLKPKAS
ncbi:MAG: TolC family protein [Halioglobus sp.]|nr:TolC family protein [Halioglobus sp.]